MPTDNHNSKYKRHFVIRCHLVQGSRHSEAMCSTPDSQSQMSLQPSNTTSGPISPCDTVTPLRYPPSSWQGLNSCETQTILAEVSTKVQTSPHGDNSVTVSGTTCTPSVTGCPTNSTKKHTTFCPCNQRSPPKRNVSNICTCSTVLCRGTESSGEVDCQQARGLLRWSVRVWHQHYRKAEHVFRQWKTRTQRCILQEKANRMRGCTDHKMSAAWAQWQLVLYAGYLAKYMLHLISALQKKWTTNCGRLKLLFLFVF